jgi:hypothetical protein
MTQAVAAATATAPEAMEPFTPPFARVKPDELAAHWAFVENGLNHVRILCDEPWSAEDILARLVDERAALYLRDDGFLILEQCEEPISLKRYLNVWVMWFRPGQGRKVRDISVQWLDAMKLAHGCAWWQFSSPRDGWAGMEPLCERYRTIWRRK